jgi:type I restriction enzyme M protein
MGATDDLEPAVNPLESGHSPRIPRQHGSRYSDKSLESWIWDAACSIRGAKDAPKYKDYILPLIFTKRLCDVFDDELNRIAAEVGSRKKAFQLVKADKKLVRFYLPAGAGRSRAARLVRHPQALRQDRRAGVTTHMRHRPGQPAAAGHHRPRGLQRHHPRPARPDDDRLSNLIEAISTKRLGLDDVEADIIGKSYEYLIRKFAEGGGQSAGEFYTPPEVGRSCPACWSPNPAWRSTTPAAAPAACW